MKNLEHIGIAVKSLEESKEIFEKLLNTKAYKEENVESEAVKTLFFKVGSIKIELLESTSEEGPIARHIEKRGEGIHHLAFEVENIDEEIVRLKEDGFRILNDVPKNGADNKRISFLHPKDSGSVLIEICQERSDESGER